MNLQTWIKSLEDEEQAFRRSILADPWDKTNWMVYADCLRSTQDPVLRRIIT